MLFRSKGIEWRLRYDQFRLRVCRSGHCIKAMFHYAGLSFLIDTRLIDTRLRGQSSAYDMFWGLCADVSASSGLFHIVLISILSFCVRHFRSKNPTMSCAQMPTGTGLTGPSAISTDRAVINSRAAACRQACGSAIKFCAAY